MGLFFSARHSLGPGSCDDELDVLLDQFLEAAIVLDGLLEIAELFGRNVSRHIPAVFVALVVMVRPLGPLPDDADGASIHALDLGDLLQDGFGGEMGVHAPNICHRHI